MTETTIMNESDTINNAPAADSISEITPLEALTQAQAEIAQLKEQLASTNTKAVENLDGWQRVQAEFANYRRRQQNELASLRAKSTIDLVKRLLPIIDDFDRASKNMPESLKDNNFVVGLMLVQRKLQTVIEAENVKPIVVNPNDRFNPNLHEAVTQDTAEGIDSGNVIDELQRGYMIGDQVLRPTLVRVAH
jgi:molecular chaperone GrpE